MRGQCTGNERPQLLLVFLPANAADCRHYVKFWGDMIADVSTQCVVGSSLAVCFSFIGIIMLIESFHLAGWEME